MNDPNNNEARSFAEEGLEAVQEEAPAAEAAVPVDSPAQASADEDEDMQQVSGLEPVDFFYRFTAPKKTPKNPFKILEVGQTVAGTYVRTFRAGKFKAGTHLVRLKPLEGEKQGKLIGFPGSGSIDKAFLKIVEGARVKIRYDGMSEIKSGEWAGNNAHNCTILASKLKSA